jgi:hypothetical protein
MWQFLGFIGILFEIAVFYSLPFLLAVVLPAWGIPSIIKRILNRKSEKLPSLLPFTLSLVFLAFLAILLWEFVMFNRVYYEWDHFGLPYTFFWHASPVSDGSPNWIARGWKTWYLYVIWLMLTIAIYVISAIFAYWKNRASKHLKLYRNILLGSVISLTIISLILPQLVSKGIGFFWRVPSNIDYQEVNMACTSSSIPGKKIFYTGDQDEWISDLTGGNLRHAFKKHLQLRASRGALSHDGTMAAILWGPDLWVYCLNSDGAFKISLPKFENEEGMNELRSSPSWSPDNKKMVMNNHGDLLLIDLTKKTTSVLKHKMSLRDNNVDLTAKNRDFGIPLFEFGDAYWSPDGIIYYTAFNGDSVSLHKFNPQVKEDKVITKSNNLITFHSGDSTGKWLFVSENSWAEKRDKDNAFSKNYFLNTQTSQVLGVDMKDNYQAVWSSSGNFIAQSTMSWMSSPTSGNFPAFVTNLETKQSFNITEIMRKTLEQKGIHGKVLVVEIKDFVDDSRILVKATIPGAAVPRQINGILNIGNSELTVLQDYPENSSTTYEAGRIDPFQIIN